MDADIESLGRMVVNFLIQESPELTSEQILALEREVFISSLPELSFLVTGTVRQSHSNHVPFTLVHLEINKVFVQATL
jgi:hypothetical protein